MFYLLLPLLLNCAVALETFTEHVEITPANDGRVISHFVFNTTWTHGPHGRPGHYSVFPASMGELAHHAGVMELHVSFAHGRWDANTWGASPDPAPTGAQVVAWFLPTVHNDSEKQKEAWSDLTHKLSGIFGGSLNVMQKETEYCHPTRAFTPTSSLARGRQSKAFYAQLPREPACTENLTPWANLLPCRQRAGLASLLEPHRVCGATSASMQVHLVVDCIKQKHEADCSPHFHLTQTLTLAQRGLGAAPKHAASMKHLFGKDEVQSCALAQSSTIGFTTTRVQDVKVSPVDVKMVQRDGHGPILDISPVFSTHFTTPSTHFDLSWTSRLQQHSAVTPHHSDMEVARFLTGLSRYRCSLQMALSNRMSHVLRVHVIDSLPWYLRVNLHTLRVVVDGTLMSGSDYFSWSSIQPGTQKTRTVVEYELVLRPNSSVVVIVGVDKAFLHIDSHPPDANRGFDVASALVSFTPYNEITKEDIGRTTRIYTDGMLVQLATPDFSMPYNVITLTCTILALFFGSIFNAVTRKLPKGYAGLGKAMGYDRPLLVRSLLALANLVRRKRRADVEEDEGEGRDAKE